ncbi:hypothetical protein L0337_45800 [candidate division KSB1 bacterium]|nr:hypothetical protein [candidate division KSB1 bacterium]
MSKIIELYGISTRHTDKPDWKTIAKIQSCPYLDRKCLKARKSNPNQTIGTCSVSYGRQSNSRFFL